MSIAATYPRLDALGLTIHNSGGQPFVDATELAAALTRHGFPIPYNLVVGAGGPTISTGYWPWTIESTLNRYNGAAASFGPTIGQIQGCCP